MSFPEKIVIHLYAEHDHRRGGGDAVRDRQRPVLRQDALDDEQEAAETHQEECRQGDAVSVAGADGVDGLRHIAQNHAHRGGIANDVAESEVKHNTFFSL